jgi:septal ring factor EnvC (AmiA/AmiB activator)
MRKSGTIGAILVAALAVGLARGAAALTPAEELKQVERKLDAERTRQDDLESRSSTLDQEMAALRGRLVRSAAAVQQSEAAVAVLETDVAMLDARHDAKRQEWDRNRAGLAAALAALIRLRRSPPEALALQPALWTDTSRTLSLLGKTVPALRDRVARLSGDLEELAALRGAKDDKLAALGDANAKHRRESGRLESLLRRKSSLQATVMADRRHAAGQTGALAKQAKDLKGLVQVLIAAAARPTKPAPLARPDPAPAAPRRAPKPRRESAPDHTLLEDEVAQPPIVPSSLPLPAFGEVVLDFGDRTDSEPPSQGVTLKTRESAQVIAPHDGRIVFVGPFRGYGELLIIEHSEEYHTLLAGFSHIHGEVGQWVRAGEPVGIMGRGAGLAPRLYIEVRRNGQPINPLAWLESGNRKVSG